jgi:hypothetical protein
MPLFDRIHSGMTEMEGINDGTDYSLEGIAAESEGPF